MFIRLFGGESRVELHQLPPFTRQNPSKFSVGGGGGGGRDGPRLEALGRAGPGVVVVGGGGGGGGAVESALPKFM